MPVLRTVIQETHQKLEAAGIPDARLEAEVLVMNVMRMARHNIFGEQDTEVSEQQQTALDELLERRYNREPLAYLLGQREFYGINVMLTPAVSTRLIGMAVAAGSRRITRSPTSGRCACSGRATT